MKVEFEVDEAWNLMSLVIQRLIEETPLSDSDRAKIRRWKTDEMRTTSQEMRVLAQKINEDLRATLERKTRSQLRRPDWA
ncbi:MAG TPA: hypothetical protein VNN10_02070 [Dehalococcoidia bacterium]|nr:hypothetical protein [Dehalococcoidia bacterium]